MTYTDSRYMNTLIGIAGKFGGQKIWRIVLKVEKVKVWRNLNLANSYRLA